MGKLLRKYKGIDEVAVMEVSHNQIGVRTRAMAEEEEKEESVSVSVATTKRRKLNSTSQHFHSNSSYIHQLRSHCRRKIMQNSTDNENICSSDHVLVSWCLSNGSSSELLNDNLRSLPDLEDKSHEFGTCWPYKERTEKMKNSSKCSQSNELESTGKPAVEENSRHKWTVEKMPTDAELEDFFSAAEKDEKKRFEEKYNYDIVKDVPLEGRFEWVELKQ